MRWRYGERFDEVLEDACRRFADRAAVALDGAEITFREFDARANQMARFFISRGVKPETASLCCSTAASKLMRRCSRCLRPAPPMSRSTPIIPPIGSRTSCANSGASLAVAHLRLADRFDGVGVEVAILDKERDAIAALDDFAARRRRARQSAADELAYVLYTSGTTGQPKGVAIEHRSLCNFVRVAAEAYGFGPGERVYQGMSIAFDFSIEEFWVPLVAGATLVPNTAACSLFGEELADFLEFAGRHRLLLRAHAARLASSAICRS